MRFHTEVLREGKTATGLHVPDEVVAGLGAGKRPAVRITINGYSYRTTAMFMGGRYLVPLAAEHRVGAGVSAGEEIDVDIELDNAVREVLVPLDLAAALAEQPSVQAFFDQLPLPIAKNRSGGWRTPRSPRPDSCGSRRPSTSYARVDAPTDYLTAPSRARASVGSGVFADVRPGGRLIFRSSCS
jgi:hypothetical protein